MGDVYLCVGFPTLKTVSLELIEIHSRLIGKPKLPISRLIGVITKLKCQELFLIMKGNRRVRIVDFRRPRLAILSPVMH
jgi:hypothetical protein